MLSKTNRLTRKKDFDEVFKKGKSFKSGFLIFKALKNSSKEKRIGFVVSKKVSNKATTRNKVKRRLRAAVLKELGSIKKPADIIIIALPGAEKMEFPQIQKIIAGFFKNV